MKWNAVTPPYSALFSEAASPSNHAPARLLNQPSFSAVDPASIAEFCKVWYCCLSLCGQEP